MRLAALAVAGGLRGCRGDGQLPMGQVWLAEGFIDRFVGMFATSGDLPLLLQDCRRVHGFGLSRPLFLTFLDRRGVVLSNGLVLEPWMTAGESRASHVLESFVSLALPIGCRLEWHVARAYGGR